MDQADTEVEREERAIYVILLVACSPILIALLLQPRAIDGGNTLVLIGLACGVAGLTAGMRALRRLPIPPARVVRPTTSRRAADSRRPPR